MSSPRAISEIKKDLESFVGSKIRLKANRGRNRIVEKEGVLESIYPNIFVVKLLKISYLQKKNTIFRLD